MQTLTKTRHEVWAQLLLSDQDSDAIHRFFVLRGIKSKRIASNFHITLYHARRPMPDLNCGTTSVNIMIPASETRFMVMAPGGENPRPEIDPSARKVGIRVQWQSSAMPALQRLRKQLIAHETPTVLSRRPKSTSRTNAFGARSFQAHMTLLRAGSGIGPDLKPIGDAFRQAFCNLHFDRFLVEHVCRTP